MKDKFPFITGDREFLIWDSFIDDVKSRFPEELIRFNSSLVLFWMSWIGFTLSIEFCLLKSDIADELKDSTWIGPISDLCKGVLLSFLSSWSIRVTSSSSSSSLKDMTVGYFLKILLSISSLNTLNSSISSSLLPKSNTSLSKGYSETFGISS